MTFHPPSLSSSAWPVLGRGCPAGRCGGTLAASPDSTSPLTAIEIIERDARRATPAQPIYPRLERSAVAAALARIAAPRPAIAGLHGPAWSWVHQRHARQLSPMAGHADTAARRAWAAARGRGALILDVGGGRPGPIPRRSLDEEGAPCHGASLARLGYFSFRPIRRQGRHSCRARGGRRSPSSMTSRLTYAAEPRCRRPLRPAGVLMHALRRSRTCRTTPLRRRARHLRLSRGPARRLRGSWHRTGPAHCRPWHRLRQDP
jgi:hypothetical protein